MFTVNAPKKERRGFTVTVNQGKVATGHNAHRGGAGTHADRRTNRNRTRSAQRRAAVSEF